MKKHIISIRKLTAPAIFISLVFLYLTPCYAKQVTLTWNASPGATGYKIYYKTGRPGPPYNGTDATRNYSPQVFNSPIVIGASRRATIHVPDGIYRFALTAYNKYGESDYSTEVLTVPNTSKAAPPDTDYSTCKSQKVNAARNFCSRLLFAYSNEIKTPYSFDHDTVVENSEAIFESNWENTEARALINGDNCPTASMEYIGDIIFLAVEDMVQQVSGEIDLENAFGKSLGSLLLNEIKERCVSSFQNNGPETFQTHWDQYVAWGLSNGITYYGPPSSDIEDMIDDLVSDVLAEIL